MISIKLTRITNNFNLDLMHISNIFPRFGGRLTPVPDLSFCSKCYEHSRGAHPVTNFRCHCSMSQFSISLNKNSKSCLNLYLTKSPGPPSPNPRLITESFIYCFPLIIVIDFKM